MSSKEDDSEIYRPAFTNGYPDIASGLPFPAACEKHVFKTFQAERVYIIASASLARNTDNLEELLSALSAKFFGCRRGMTPHGLWSEVLEVTKQAKEANAEIIATIGAGSLTGAAKIIALVSLTSFVYHMELQLSGPGTRQ